MGNLCIPDTGVDSLELTIPPAAKHQPRDLHKQPPFPDEASHFTGTDDDSKRR